MPTIAAPSWLNPIADHDAVRRLIAHCTEGGLTSVRGVIGSSSVLVGACIAMAGGGPLLIVVAHLDDADETRDELTGLGIDAVRFPAMEILPGESSVSIDLVAERFSLLRRLNDGNAPDVIVAPMQALMQRVPPLELLTEQLRRIDIGATLDPAEFAEWLVDRGYQRVDSIEAHGEFSVRGGIIDLFPAGALPVRIDLFGDEVESLHEVDLDTMGSDRKVEFVDVISTRAGSLDADESHGTLLNAIPDTTAALLVELLELQEQARSYYNRVGDSRGIVEPGELTGIIVRHCRAVIEFNQYSRGVEEERIVTLALQTLPAFSEDAAEAVTELNEIAALRPTVVVCQNEGEAQRMGELLTEFAPEAKIEVVVAYLHRGFILAPPEAPEAEFAIVPYHELLNRFQTRRQVRRLSSGRSMDTFLELEVGDYVVHRDHGIAKFIGLQPMKNRNTGVTDEFLTLEFAKAARLHVPAAKIELVQKYVGGFHGKPELSVMGGLKWQKQKDKVGEAVRDLAGEMLRIQAARESMPGIRYAADTAWQHEFEAEFPYQETEDQLQAIAACKKDMTSPRPMDRLICGDVGFGKTEVAIRAAFKAAEFGKQVAVLVPTTVLAEQHERTFSQRFADYPFRVESVSRFKTAKEAKATLDAVRRGEVDILIGTHRLLSKDVHFADLGLVIVDEEQRFGVEHKQRLLSYRMTVDVLTLSATPIPRTLHMAMLGLRDISSLSMAPPDRRSIVTEVIGYDSGRIRQAIERELAREGQVFFVHNRVHNIESVAADIKRLVPDARIIVGHGQMPSRQLESVMLKFMRREVDVLVSTTIIESGIDIPTANTMFINDGHMFGLSELHQLRGRVGRYKHRAYCYLLLPQDRVLSEVAVKRMRAIESFSMLGAGFRIAMRDMEIRGVGNLLGAEQSGHIAVVGYEMYCQLLERAVDDLRHGRRINPLDTVIDLGITATIPKGYIPSDTRRMDAYRRISRADSLESLDQVTRDLESAYGDLPRTTRQLVELTAIRIAATLLGIRSIVRKEQDIIFRTPRPGDLETCFAGAQGSLRPVGQPDAEGLLEVYYRPPSAFLEPATLLTVLRRRLRPQEPEAATAGGAVT